MKCKLRIFLIEKDTQMMLFYYQTVKNFVFVFLFFLFFVNFESSPKL